MSKELAFEEGYQKFKSCIYFYGYFHIGFISFLSLQLLSFLLFFSYFSQSLVAACALAVFFLTLFSYFVLLFFFQAKKPEQMLSIRSNFFKACESHLSHYKDSSTALFMLCTDLHEFVSFLNTKESFFYTSPIPFQTIKPLAEKFKVWLYWKNFHELKELFFLLSIKQLVELVKQAPTDLEVHGNLAKTYLDLSKLYVHPEKSDSSALKVWISPEYTSIQMKEKFLFYSKKALEEFKILEEFSPNNPWVYAHLAEIYRLQGNLPLEIETYEKLLEASPANEEVLFRLGVLYFQLAYNAKGLKTYETLLQESPEKAKELIEHYDSLHFS